MSVFVHIFWTSFTLWDTVFMLVITVRGTIFMNMAILEKEAFMALLFVDKMGPKVTFIDQSALMMTGEVVDVIKIEDINNVVQFGSTDVVVWDAWVNWWVIRT